MFSHFNFLENAMMRRMLAGAVAMAVVMACGAAAFGADKDDVMAAAKKLADAPNYTFTTAQTGGMGGGGGRGPAAPVDTKIDKAGYTTYSVSAMGGDAFEVVMKGDKAVAKGADGAWKTKAELQKASEDAGGFSPEMIVVMRVNSFAAPAAQVQTLVEKAKSVKKEADGAYSAELAEASAKDLLTFKMPAGAAGGMPEMTIKDPKGTLKVWVKDGTMSKMELKLTGSMSFGDQDMPADRTTTNEIKDVGTTKVTPPEAAVKKLEAAK
jgi:hypothetical protein